MSGATASTGPATSPADSTGGSGAAVSDTENMKFWEYNEHNLDTKGRLVLPASFREEFAGGGILAFGGNHAMIHTLEGWKRVAANLEKGTEYTPRELAVIKSFATQFSPDAQNRVKVPDRLRSAAGLDREVALIGMGHYVALYSLDRWRQIQSDFMSSTDSDSDLMDRLSDSLSLGGQ